MFIEFRVKNFRSLREEQVLTWEAAKLGDKDDPRPRKIPGHNESLLPVTAIYGANASGKTNVLAALAFMQECITDSSRRWRPQGIDRAPFGWGDANQEPSLFELTFLKDGIKYNYGFVLDDQTVLEEWLYTWPKQKKARLFERDQQEFKFGDRLEGPNETIEKVTRPNSLYLSAAAQFNHKNLTEVHKSFHKKINSYNTRGHKNDYLLYAKHLGIYFHSELATDDIAHRGRFLSFLQNADLGIVDINVVHDTPETTFSTIKYLYRHAKDDENSWLEFKDESGGTQALHHLSMHIFPALDNGQLLIIDELESSLHPLLACKIIELFNNPETNPRNAQLLFTTHDTNLLGTTLGEPVLRRDQIWFTEKDNTGGTTLYPLTDFKPRQVENLERGYLQGRYGAIPFLGDWTHLGECHEPQEK